MNSVVNIKAVPTSMPAAVEEIDEISVSSLHVEAAEAVESFRSVMFRVAELSFTPQEEPVYRLMTSDEYVLFARRNVRLSLGLPESAGYRQVRQRAGLPFLAPTINAESLEEAEYRHAYEELKESNLSYLLDRAYNGNYKMLLV